ncbi:MAG TPA: hypothetical protein VED41_07410 [Solirubrobacteraceae bacterium]|nr:hypothetical protein [Solirubrobacteraceae bacterium]
MDTVADMSTLRWLLADEPRLRTDSAIALIGRGNGLPQWLNPIVARIEALAELDTINPEVERPLNVEDVLDALEFLDRVMAEDTSVPWIGRLSSGGVELAWKHADVEVEAVFDRLRGEAELIVAVGDNEWNAPIAQGDSLFASIVDRLSNSYIEHTAGAPATFACA